MHIFVAEDEKTIRRELTILLENAMYQVTAPENFENIPDWITEASPDLILLDVNLPGMSGFDICTSLRQRENTCPVIFLTSRTDSMDELNGMLPWTASRELLWEATIILQSRIRHQSFWQGLLRY